MGRVGSLTSLRSGGAWDAQGRGALQASVRRAADASGVSVQPGRSVAALGLAALVLAIVAIASTMLAEPLETLEVIEVPVDIGPSASFRSLATIPSARRNRALGQVCRNHISTH